LENAPAANADPNSNLETHNSDGNRLWNCYLQVYYFRLNSIRCTHRNKGNNRNASETKAQLVLKPPGYKIECSSSVINLEPPGIIDVSRKRRRSHEAMSKYISAFEALSLGRVNHSFRSL